MRRVIFGQKKKCDFIAAALNQFGNVCVKKAIRLNANVLTERRRQCLVRAIVVTLVKSIIEGIEPPHLSILNLRGTERRHLIAQQLAKFTERFIC